ncbi:MAG TPA: 1-phosphofructokinase family hexose kinase [Deltaproteobacteria bacterium]|nr:1-phosphofructokinase family hexose kinase [Deltaproteobacteria bacterium]HQB39065.1 1-phosphofructokinase family hexose kinase [Deltaproteobacteria bacterium]
MKKIVTITMNPSVDKSAHVAQVIGDRKLYCHSPRFEPGGGGVNVSRAIRKLGGDSLAMFPLGGPAGEHLKLMLQGEGLVFETIPSAGWTRENLVIQEENSGSQFRFGMPGAPMEVAEWQACLDRLASLENRPDYIVASGSLPPGVPDDFYARVAEIGRRLDARVIVDTTGDPLRRALDAGVFMIKPNIRELVEMANGSGSAEADPHQVAAGIVRSGRCQVVAMSMGAGGVLFVTADRHEHMRTPVVPFKSKVGAGDSMVAGTVLALARGKELRDAVRFGIASGAAAVMTPGSELCRREDAERLYSQMENDV